ncbi:F-box only protein 24 [Phyllobates terribilis]|uniref:F-box only protein 24 n=1 Tax=Phyllobates terribilis TaxID=111132 RepID=UPI003CCAEECF
MRICVHLLVCITINHWGDDTWTDTLTNTHVKKQHLEREPNPRGRNVTLQDLPPELVEHIISFLSLRDVMLLGETCRFLHQVCNSCRSWRSLYQRIRPQHTQAANWRRLAILHYTKGIFFHSFSSRQHLCGQTVSPISSNGFQRFLATAHNLYVLDYTGALFHLRGSIRNPGYTVIRGEWRTYLEYAPLCQDVKDFTCDSKSDASYHRYLYVLASREVLDSEVSRRCDSVEIYVQSSGQRVFKMTFHPSMNFQKISLMGAETERQLLLLTDTGKVYSITINERSLNRPRAYTTQLTLRRMSSGPAPRPVTQVYSHQSSALYVTDDGAAFLEAHTPAVHRDLFENLHWFHPQETQTPRPISLPNKVALCSLGFNHLALVDEFGRIFMQGNNRFGQLGTGDKIDRRNPCLIPYYRKPIDIFCGLHHTLVLTPSLNSVKELHGCGCGAGGRLPGWPYGSPTFVKLLLKIPVCARRISSTRNCLYIMSSYDTEENPMYCDRPGSSVEEDAAVVQVWEECLNQLRRCTNVHESVAKTKDFIRHLALPEYQKDWLWDALGMIQRTAETGDTCGAILYCSEECKRQNWKKCPQDISHEFWCAKMKLFMQDEERLADLPFYFIKEVTSRAFNKELFLSGCKLTGGYWAVESIHYHPSCLQAESRAWNLGGGRGEPLLKDMELLLRQQPKDRLKSSLVSWKEFYKWRGLSLNNPIAALLTYPLTVYYIISELVPQHFPELNILKKQSLKVHILEAGREYGNVLLFWELVVLMPYVVLELVFVGNDLPKEEDDRSFIIHKRGSEVVCSDITYADNDRGVRGIHVKVHARPYHVLQVAKPDLVIGFNSGFGLDDTWLSTLPRLQAMKVPAYFSDCSRYSCDVDAQVVAAATGGRASAPKINPFRSPLRIVATDDNLPWYNNAFLFYLIYKCHHSVPKKRNNHRTRYSAVHTATPETAASPQKKKNKPGRNRSRKRR